MAKDKDLFAKWWANQFESGSGQSTNPGYLARDAFLAGMRAGRRSERRKVAKLKAEICDIYMELFPAADIKKIFRKLS